MPTCIDQGNRVSIRVEGLADGSSWSRVDRTVTHGGLQAAWLLTPGRKAHISSTAAHLTLQSLSTQFSSFSKGIWNGDQDSAHIVYCQTTELGACKYKWFSFKNQQKQTKEQNIFSRGLWRPDFKHQAAFYSETINTGDSAVCVCCLFTRQTSWAVKDLCTMVLQDSMQASLVRLS